MDLPPLVDYKTVKEYQAHFERVYCRDKIYTIDGIRIYFHPHQFGHVFYESSARDGHKDMFSRTRAQRIDWIKATLQHPKAEWFQGWDNKARQYNPRRRVAVVYENFVVVVMLGLKKDGAMKGNFITCYQADNSIGKIRSAPSWSRAVCVRQLSTQKKDR